MDKLRQEYQDKLNQAKAPINKEALWDKIATDPQFPVKNNKRIKLWVVCFAIVGLLLIGGLYLNQNKPAAFSSTENVNIAVEETTRSETKTSQTATSDFTAQEKTDLSVQNQSIISNENISVERENNNSNALNDSALNLDENKEIVAQKKPVTYNNDNNHSNNNNNTDENINAAPLALAENSGEFQKLDRLASNSSSKQKEVIEEIKMDQGSQVSNTSSTNAEPRIVSRDNSGTSTDQLQSSEVTQAETLDIPKTKLDLSPAISGLIPSLSYLYKTDLGTKSITVVNNATPKWSFGLATGIGYHWKNINVIKPLPDNDITNLRSKNTRALESYIIQADLHREIRKNWHLGIGAQWTKMFEEYVYMDSTIVYTRNDLGADKFYSARSGDSYHNFHTIQQLDLRLNLKRVWDFDKVSLAINTGVNYNLSLGMSGVVTDSNFQEISIASGRNYRSRLGLRSFAGLEMIKPMFQGETFFSLQVEQRAALHTATSNLSHTVLPIYGLLGYRKSF